MNLEQNPYPAPDGRPQAPIPGKPVIGDPEEPVIGAPVPDDDRKKGRIPETDAARRCQCPAGSKH